MLRPLRQTLSSLLQLLQLTNGSGAKSWITPLRHFISLELNIKTRWRHAHVISSPAWRKRAPVSVELHLRDGRTDGRTLRIYNSRRTSVRPVHLLDGVWHLGEPRNDNRNSYPPPLTGGCRMWLAKTAKTFHERSVLFRLKQTVLTETKQFQNCLKLFCFSFISLCGRY